MLHNPQAVELGVVRGGVADPRARSACRQVACGPSDGSPVEVDLSPLERRGREPAAVLGQVRGLGDGFTVVEATDSSDAVRLEATRRDFVANVSHELKTPVGAVGLLAEAVLDAADDPAEVRRFAGRILKESTRLGALVTELIALSRLTRRGAAPRAVAPSTSTSWWTSRWPGPACPPSRRASRSAWTIRRGSRSTATGRC